MLRAPWLSRGMAGVGFVAVTLWTLASYAAPAPDSFADLAEKLLPAVVNISTTQTVKDTDRVPDMPQFPPGSPFDEFFKNFMQRQGQGQGGQGGQPDSAPRKVTALGSGFIIDSSGLVVTNNHVIEDADEINVILHDGKSYTAKLLGKDARVDLALLKIETPDKLPSVPFGDSDAMRVGDWVLAIGNPFGLGGSVTAGIISARARDINAGPYDDFIQTDAAINKGNSGGPLLNMKGEVIGVNAAIYSPSGGSIGIGFSIPSNQVKPAIADLQKYGKIRRGWIGVRIQSVTDDIADSLGLKNDKGALVADVTAGGPGEKAGLKQGDVILGFDGKTVAEMRDLPRSVANTPIGKTADISVWRDGHAQSQKITVGLLPDEDQKVASAGRAPGKKAPKAQAEDQGSLTKLGLKVGSLTADLRKQYDIGTTVKGGVVVTNVSNGPAADIGLHEGDVISEVSQEPVTDPSDLSKKIDTARSSGRKSVLLLVQNDNGSHFVSLKIDAGKATP